MKKNAFYLLTGLFSLAVLISPSTPVAAPYYEGKVITLIVGFTPGANVDAVARLLAKHLPKHIPGKPSIIVQNNPGGGSRMATNYLYEQAAPDGLTIGTFSRGFPIVQVVYGPKGKKDTGVRFDLSKFSWIGSPVVESEVFAIRSDLPYKTFDDLIKSNDTINIGLTSMGGIEWGFLGLLGNHVKVKQNYVLYPGASDIYLALERKEVDVRVGTYTSLKPRIGSGLVRPLARGLTSEPEIEHLPVNVNYTPDEKMRKVMRVISIQDKVGQPYVAPPKTPKDRMDILREAFSRWAKDPEVQADAKKLFVRPNYVSAEEAMNVVNEILNQPEEINELLRKHIR